MVSVSAYIRVYMCTLYTHLYILIQFVQEKEELSFDAQGVCVYMYIYVGVKFFKNDLSSNVI